MKNLIVFGVVLLGTVLTVEAQNSLTNGLVVYYPFTGNANDASGNGNNGTVFGATLAPDRFGQPNQAYHFDGSSRIFVANSDLVSGSALTLAAWIKPDSLSPNSMNVISPGTQNSYELAVVTNSAQGFLNFRNGAGIVPVNSAAGALQTNTWTHLAMVYDGTNLTLFINGNKVASQPASGSLYQDSEAILNIGAYQYYFGGTVYNDAFGGFVGTIDEVRIYNRALSAQEIAELAPPNLGIASTGNQSVLFWPASATNYVLQTTTNLSSPNWVAVSNGCPIIGVTLTNALPAAFFRLTTP